MQVLLLAFCMLATTNVRLTDNSSLDVFFEHLSAAKWPQRMVNHPADRIVRDKDGNIVRLCLDGMRLVPGDLEALRLLRTLQSIDLSYTNIADAEIKKLAAVRNLKSLQLNHTGIGDEGVKRLADLPNLQVLCLGGVKARLSPSKRSSKQNQSYRLATFEKGNKQTTEFTDSSGLIATNSRDARRQAKGSFLTTKTLRH
jgi:hypothetical protein